MQDVIDTTALGTELSATEETLLEMFEDALDCFNSYAEDLEIYESATGKPFHFGIFTRREFEILKAAAQQMNTITGAARERLLQ